MTAIAGSTMSSHRQERQRIASTARTTYDRALSTKAAMSTANTSNRLAPRRMPLSSKTTAQAIEQSRTMAIAPNRIRRSSTLLGLECAFAAPACASLAPIPQSRPIPPATAEPFRENVRCMLSRSRGSRSSIVC